MHTFTVTGEEAPWFRDRRQQGAACCFCGENQVRAKAVERCMRPGMGGSVGRGELRNLSSRRTGMQKEVSRGLLQLSVSRQVRFLRLWVRSKLQMIHRRSDFLDQNMFSS